MKRRALRFFGESALWALANFLCMAVPLGAVYLAGTHLGGWGPGRLTLYMGVAALWVSTWGSWAGLIWTRDRFLRTVQQGVATLPGTVALVLGGLLLYFGVGGWFLALLLCGGGLGMIVASVLLSGGLLTINDTPNRFQYLLGLLVYPLVTTALAGIVGMMWYSFASGSAATVPTGWRDIFSLATVMITTLSGALISTVVPALTSRACQQFSGALARRRR